MMKKTVVTFSIITVVVLMVLVTVRINYDENRGVWHITGFGLSAVCFKDRQTGPTCWLYIGDNFVRQWPGRPTPYPTATPYPTYTPYPTHTPPGMQSA